MALSDLRGAAQLACDATVGVTSVVEQVHGTIIRLPLPLGPMRRTPHAGVAKLVYGSIRGTARLVGRTIGTALGPFQGEGSSDLPDSLQAESSPGRRDAMIAALNGVCGDHLAASNNPLAIPMTLRVVENAHPEESPDTPRSRRWLILIHGLCMSDRQWQRDGHDHGLELARALGMTPVYLRYNTGLGVAENGEQLSEQLEQFFADHVGADDEMAMLAYSLGGLVTRSALASANGVGHRWPERLQRLVFLGTPHNGAPLAKGGHGLDRALNLSPYSAPFARLVQARSRGLHDLHMGLGPDLSDVPGHVKTCSLAGSLSDRAGLMSDGLLGDGLVPVGSAFAQGYGAAANSARPEPNRWLGRGVGHLDLLSHGAVYEQLEQWLN